MLARRSPRWAGALVVAIVCVLSAAAGADAEGLATVTLATNTVLRNRTSGGTEVALAVKPVWLAEGQKVHLRGRVEATSNVTRNVLLAASVRCRLAGRVIGGYGTTTRNHEGTDATFYDIPGRLAVTVNWLVTAPSTGTYTCELTGSADSSTGAGDLTAVAGSTWLATSASPISVGNQWVQEACGGAGQPACLYLGGAIGGRTNPRTASVLRPSSAGADGAVITGGWIAAASATSASTTVEALGDVEVTTCYLRTGSCPTFSTGQLPLGAGAVVDTRLELVQLSDSGATCAVTTSPSAGTGTSPDRNSVRTTIRDDAHHVKIHHVIKPVPARTTCGSLTPRFVLRIVTTWVSGQPVRIEPRLSSGMILGVS